MRAMGSKFGLNPGAGTATSTGSTTRLRGSVRRCGRASSSGYIFDAGASASGIGQTGQHRRPKGEGMLVFLLSLFLVGLIAGGLARLIVPRPDPIGILGAALLRIVAAFVRGL